MWRRSAAAAIGAFALIAGFLALSHGNGRFRLPAIRTSGRLRSPSAAALGEAPAGPHCQREPIAATTASTNIPARVDVVDLIERLRALLRTGAAQEGDETFRLQLQTLAHADPRAAVLFATALDVGRIREEALRTVVRQWSQDDRKSALDWAAAVEDPLEHNSILSDIVLQVSASDPATAVTIAELYGIADADGLLENLVAGWMERNPIEAFAWVSRLPAGNERDRCVGRVALALAAVSPQSAVDLSEMELSSSKEMDATTLSVVHAWGLQDPASANRWVSRIGNDSLRARAQEELRGILRYRQASN